MAQGKKPKKRRLATSEDLSRYIPQFMDYIEGKRNFIVNGQGPDLTIPHMCTFMEAIVEQADAKRLKGRIVDVREGLHKVTEACMMADFANRTQLNLIEGVRRFGDLSVEAYARWKDSALRLARQNHINTAALVVQLFVHLRSQPKAPHRPRGSETKAWSDIDDQILDSVMKRAAFKTETDGDERIAYFHGAVAFKELRTVITEMVSQKQIRALGETGIDKQSIDTHHKRLKRKLNSRFRQADKK
jgi:hypothetical protein